MEEALVARLLANVPLETGVETRINWIERPQGEGLPAITLQVIDAGDEYHHGGRVDLLYPLIQFDCWGRSYLEAKTAARALLSEIELPRHDVSGVDFEDGFAERQFDRPVDQLEDGTKVYGVTIDARVPYRAAEGV